MKGRGPHLAGFQFLLLLPALLFMGAVVLRSFAPMADAQRIVMLYAGKQWTLWVLLVSLPLAALICGGIAIVRGRNEKAAGVSLRVIKARPLVALMTIIATVVLAVVGIHVLAN